MDCRFLLKKRHSIRAALLSFFDAENNRDWKSCKRYLSTNVRWVSFEPPKKRVVRGISSYVSAMKRAYRGNRSRFTVETIAADEEKQVAIVELLFDGRRSVDVFEFENGLIRREREYFDDTFWRRSLGLDRRGSH